MGSILFYREFYFLSALKNRKTHTPTHTHTHTPLKAVTDNAHTIF